MPGPLHGVRVLEITEIIAGPLAGMLLSDMGADVIKVEPPWGEPWRFTDEFIPNESRTFISLNRGKRSAPLDLTKPEGLEIIQKLTPAMDVVIVNVRPDVARKLHIDYETLSAINPQLIYCDITAFGRSGTYSHRPGYDIIIQAMTGLMASEFKVTNGVPQQIQATPISDFATGIVSAWAICAALYSRENSNKGQKIEASLLATALTLQSQRFTQIAAVDDGPRAEFLGLLTQLRKRGATYEEILNNYQEGLVVLRVGNIYYRTYQAKDGVLAVGCLSDPIRKRLLCILGLKDIRFHADYDMFSEKAQLFGDQLVKSAEALFRQKSVDEWLSLLDEAGVPAGPVHFVEELVDSDLLADNDLVVDLEHSLAGKVKMAAPLVKMSGTPLEAKSASPALGEHITEVLSELGYDPEAIQELKDKKITI